MLRSYHFIDLFRGLAAYWVIVSHSFIWSGWIPGALPNTKIAVDLFMMISGFLMVANAEGRAGIEPLHVRSSRSRFWIRRFFRLAPLYYVSLASVVLSSSNYLAGFSYLQQLNPSYWPTGGIYDPAMTVLDVWNILLHVTFAFGLSPSYSFSTFLPDWSLSLEMQFYLMFPFLYLLMRRAGFVRIGLVLSLVCFAAGIVIQKLARFDEPSLLIFKLNYFIAGALIYRCLSTPVWNRQRVFSMAGAFCCACIDVRYGVDLLLLPLLVASMVGLGWLETGASGRIAKRVQAMLESRAVSFASETSYGVYLFHGFFISAAGWMVHSNPSLQTLSAPERVLAMLAFVTCGVYPVAYLLFRAIEKPCIAIGKTLLDRMPSSSQEGSGRASRFGVINRKIDAP